MLVGPEPTIRPFRFTVMIPVFLLLCATLSGSLGCSIWDRENAFTKTWDLVDKNANDSLAETNANAHLNAPSDRKSPLTRMRVDFLPFRPKGDTKELVDQLWAQTDVGPISADLRRLFLKNGIRVGVLDSREPVDQLLANGISDSAADLLADAGVRSEVSERGTQFKLANGKPTELPLRHPIPGTHVALRRNHEGLVGDTLYDAQYLLTLTAHPSENRGGVRLVVTPQIQHGTAGQKFVSSDVAIRINSSREKLILKSFEIDWEAAEGQILVIGPAEKESSFSRAMLSGRDSDGVSENLLVAISVLSCPMPSLGSGG